MARYTSGGLDPLHASTYRQLTCVGLVGFAFFVLSIFVAQKPLALLFSSLETTGVVTDHQEQVKFKNGEQVTTVSSGIEFTDNSGIKHTFWLHGNHPVGTTFPVTYLADEPEVASVKGDKTGLAGPSLPFVMGLAILTWTFWRTRKLLKLRKVFKGLMSRVSPITAQVISAPTETHRTTNANRVRTYHTYRLVAKAELNGNPEQEFESFRYVGFPPFEVGSPIKLYVDPANANMFYLCARPGNS